MVIGLVVIRITGLSWLDQLFAIGFAVYIILTGLHVFRRSVAGIMDEADLELAAEVIAQLEARRSPAWVDLHNFRMIKRGAVLHIDCHVTLPWYWTLERAHREISELERLIDDGNDREVELFVHVDPCVPASCGICALADCPERKTPTTRRIHWTPETVLVDRKHDATTADGTGSVADVPAPTPDQ